MDVSFAKIDITPDIRGISMLGYGNPHNIVKGVETPIQVRTTCVKGENEFLYFLLNFEICFITDSLFTPLRSFLEEMLGHKNFAIHLTAQHTHSAPSGYDYYPLYNMPTPGYVKRVHEKYLAGAKESLTLCYENLKPGRIEFNEGEIALSEDVSFNRSMDAYLNNPEVHLENLPQTRRSAVNKRMQTLAIYQADKLIGSLNWFAVHATNIPNTNFYISPDNKGYAALKVEKNFEEHIALFNQGCAGDVSPNFVKQETRGARMRGKYANPFDSAKYNGSLQANHCLSLIGTKGQDIKGDIFSQTVFRDFSDIKPDPKFLPKGAPSSARTVEPCHGVAFIQGTKEGPGIPHALGFLIKLLASAVKALHILTSYLLPQNKRERVWSLYRNQYPKSIFLNAGDKNVLGIRDISKLPIPSFIDPLIGTMKKYYKRGALNELTWVQKILPVQLTVLDNLVIAAFPGEITTIAGRRIEKQIRDAYGDQVKIIISPYSNAFCGYITTPEEYEMQMYEGGHTLFGRWTLPAFQTVLAELICAHQKGNQAESIQPPKFSEQEITLRSNSQ
tara:strand:- start:28822 stop:30501 length:1680 start_codon:yes stop_codon:yes gene_type:complete